MTRWFEKIESIFEICVCSEANKVKFVACTFIDRALTWWNGQVQTLTLLVAIVMGWGRLKELILAEYCRRGEVQKLEPKLWNLKMRVPTYLPTLLDSVIWRFSVQEWSPRKARKSRGTYGD